MEVQDSSKHASLNAGWGPIQALKGSNAALVGTIQALKGSNAALVGTIQARKGINAVIFRVPFMLVRGTNNCVHSGPERPRHR